ncbi:hypothetical protein [Ruminococcus sp.]|uniref:hypothetical protein n=1 Tax=Ruminococcus sp. TaxID=41978 RepID=UPI0025CE6534|nr:hypothetical protein [Ruminococcus sp.]MCR4638213.1 hypothetical protein [Ruminococcus sp.]
MNKIIKKISAVAMAFTLLGAGSAAIKTIAPQTNNTLVASASVPVACSHVGKGSYVTYSNWWYDPIVSVQYSPKLRCNVTITIPRWKRFRYIHCSGCRNITASVAEYHY